MKVKCEMCLRKWDLKWALWFMVFWIVQPNCCQVPNGIALDYLANRPIVPVNKETNNIYLDLFKPSWRHSFRWCRMILEHWHGIHEHSWKVMDVFPHFRLAEFLGYHFVCRTAAWMWRVLKSMEEPSTTQRQKDEYDRWKRKRALLYRPWVLVSASAKSSSQSVAL